ncbi:MAG: hypothetical protein GC204_03255 [Chloroflexi bacterium]|nr:hypothetical protein [Chloroflexota bacterium]
MSMHEYEDLIEMSVRVLDACDSAGSADTRSMFYHLYEFQAMWDTGFTHFRVMDILIRHRFVYRMAMTDHPDYAQYQDVLDRIVETTRQANASHNFSFLRVDPGRELDSAALNQMTRQERSDWYQSNPVAGYYRYPYLYADAASPLWKRLVDTGQLTGADAELPDPQMSLIEIADRVVCCAEQQQQFEVMTLWYALLPSYLVFNDEVRQAVTPALESLITVIARSDALNRAVANSPYIKRFAHMLPPVKTAEEYLQAVENLMNNADNL